MFVQVKEFQLSSEPIFEKKIKIPWNKKQFMTENNFFENLL